MSRESRAVYPKSLDISKLTPIVCSDSNDLCPSFSDFASILSRLKLSTRLLNLGLDYDVAGFTSLDMSLGPQLDNSPVLPPTFALPIDIVRRIRAGRSQIAI